MESRVSLMVGLTSSWSFINQKFISSSNGYKDKMALQADDFKKGLVITPLVGPPIGDCTHYGCDTHENKYLHGIAMEVIVVDLPYIITKVVGTREKRRFDTRDWSFKKCSRAYVKEWKEGTLDA